MPSAASSTLTSSSNSPQRPPRDDLADKTDVGEAVVDWLVDRNLQGRGPRRTPEPARQTGPRGGSAPPPPSHSSRLATTQPYH